MENVKQLLILNRNLTIKKILSINKVIPVQDIISPQKTTFEIAKNKDIVIGDLLVLKRENEVEYIGIIDNIETEKTTKLATYPLISITDTDCIMGNINGNVFNWIKETFEYNLVNTLTNNQTSDYVDKLLALPFEFKDNTNAKTLELEVKNGNLFDVLIDIFKKTGIYLKFTLQYTQGKVSNILVNVNIADENTKIALRHDNPLIFEEPVIENSQNQNVNKIIFVPSDDNTTADAKSVYVFYLLDNNTVTTNPNGTDTGKRINGVKQTIQEYSDDDYSKGLQSIAEETMLGNTLDHQITIKILQNSGFDVQLYDRVSYIDTQKTYDTYVTRIENYNDKYKTVRLGVLRTTLTDKIKNLEKLLYKKSFGVQTSGSSSGGGSSVDVYDGVDSDSATRALSARQGKILNETKADKTEIPDVSQFVTRLVDNLENYYLKSQTYTQEEINERLSTIPKFAIEVITELPTENISTSTIYLMRNVKGEYPNIFTEYIYTGSGWEILGEQLPFDLTNYPTIDDWSKLVTNKRVIRNTEGGFKGGACTTTPDEDVGSGGAIGNLAKAETGFAGGSQSVSWSGGAVGSGSFAGKGFAGGYNAKAYGNNGELSDSIQLGTGYNSNEKTMQVYDDNIYDANTHTLTVQNIELDGEDIKDLMGGDYLPLTGGTMTGALNIEGITNKEKAISIESPDSDAIISLTRTDVGNSIGVGIGGNGTARGIWDEALQKWLLMHDGSALKLNGSATRPKYNSNDLALYSDVKGTHGYKTINSSYGTGTCNYFRVGQLIFVILQDLKFTATPPNDPNNGGNILTSKLPKALVNTLFALTPHDTSKANARFAITTSGTLLGWWANITTNQSYYGFIGYVAQDGE